ncbi:Hin recombinase [Cryobacterium sp. TMT3-29-2]|nr:Hin recombinase [Cryobacterium sp. TMT3-29-2]
MTASTATSSTPLSSCVVSMYLLRRITHYYAVRGSHSDATQDVGTEQSFSEVACTNFRTRLHNRRGDAPLAEFERALISGRTVAGLAAARARGRTGGRPFKMTPATIRLAMAVIGQKETKVRELCKELGITRQTLYRHVSPTGELRPDGAKFLSKNWRPVGTAPSSVDSKG